MNKFIDLTGRKFNKLLVLSFAGFNKRHQSTWNCLCDCGKEKIIIGVNLTFGATKSCGCSMYKDLTNMRYGKLLAISIAGRNKRGQMLWNCLCDCGKSSIVISADLVRGKTKSCGCGLLKHGLSKTKEYSIYHSRKRKELKTKLDSAWTLEMEKLLKVVQPICILCGSQDRLEIDHVLPLSKGFGLEPGNAVILCKSCNSSKRAKELSNLPEEIKNKLIYYSHDFEKIWSYYDRLLVGNGKIF